MKKHEQKNIGTFFTKRKNVQNQSNFGRTL